MNGVRYRDIIRNLLWSELDNMDVDRMWFQEAGRCYTCNTANEIMALLRDKFNGRVISRRGTSIGRQDNLILTP